MMGLFKRQSAKKGSSEEVAAVQRSKPWNPFAKVATEASGTAEAAMRGFCDPETKVPCVTVCSPKSGCECGCDGVRKALSDEIAKRQIKVVLGAAKVGCDGSCKNGPIIGFPQKKFFYVNVRPENVPEIVEETIIHGRILFPLVSINPDRSYRSDIYYEKTTGLLAGIDDSVCMVEAAKYFMDFEKGLSCGKCVPCRLGMVRMHESMTRIAGGGGSAADLEEVELLCKTMITTPHCEFAMTSSRPVLSAITHFKDEFAAHIEGRECGAASCKQQAAQ